MPIFSPSPPRVSGPFLSRVSALTKTILSSGIFLPVDFNCELWILSYVFRLFFILNFRMIRHLPYILFVRSGTYQWPVPVTVHFRRGHFFYVNGVMVELTCFCLLSYTGRCEHAFFKTSCDFAGTNRTVFLYKIRCILFLTLSIYIIHFKPKFPPKSIHEI